MADVFVYYMKAQHLPSVDLLEAQKRLFTLRASLPLRPPAKKQPGNEPVVYTPSLLEQGQALLDERREQEALRQGRRSRGAPQAPPVHITTENDTPDNPTPKQHGMFKVYPSLAIGMLTADLAAPGRIYWLLRFIDTQGRGWVETATARAMLTGGGASLQACGWRRLRQLLHEGEGLFWHRDNNGRIWLMGAAKIAENLAVSRLIGHPVEVPVKHLLGGIQAVRAHFYASFHSGRKQQSPVSREHLRELTGVPERTQQEYDQVARVKRQRNLAIGEPFVQEKIEDRAWKQGRAVFHFLDIQGQQGPARREYIAWHLPNSYNGPHAQCSKGRQKKLNRQLVDLVMKGMRGNGRETVEKVFWQNGAAAARAYNRDQSNDAYWQRGQNQRKTYILWYVLPGEAC